MTRYIVSPSMSKVHDKKHLKEECTAEIIKEENKSSVGLKEMQELIRKAGYDLCERCFGED